MADNTLAFVRPHGRPKIEKNPKSGLRTITRTYEVDATKVNVTDVNSSIFLDYGEPDLEYPSALLTAQEIQQSADVDQATLVRQYLELPAKDVKQEISEPSVLVREGGGYLVTRKFIVALVEPVYDEEDPPNITGYTPYNFTYRYDNDSKVVNLSSITDRSVFTTTQAASKAEALTKFGAGTDTYDVERTGSTVTCYLGRRKIKNLQVYAEIEEAFHSADYMVSESERDTKYGVMTQVQVVNPTYLPEGYTGLRVTKGEAYTTVSYAYVPDQLNMYSESEQFRADGSRTVTRRYTIAKDTFSYTDDNTPATYIPEAIVDDKPDVVLTDWNTITLSDYGLTDVADIEAYTQDPANATANSYYRWILAAASVDRSRTKFDAWSITYITAALPHWVDKRMSFTRPGLLNVTVNLAAATKDTTLQWEPPAASSITVREYVAFFMSPTVTFPDINYISPSASVGALLQNEDLQIMDNPTAQKANYLIKGNLPPAGTLVKKYNGAELWDPTEITYAGDAYNDWELSGTYLYRHIEPVFKKGTLEYIWRVRTGVAKTTKAQLYGE